MFVIPRERLPAGFAERVESPPTPPAEPLPAATAILLRDRDHGAEVLLLQRHHASGFVPGAYVFPGGRVDEEDTSPAVEGLIVRAKRAGEGTLEPPAPYWAAMVREVFEETGVLLARDELGHAAADAGREPLLASWRERLLGERAGLVELLAEQRLEPALDDVVYCAHWITPIAEPRRYDTRFFLARLPTARVVGADAREMTDAIWLTPARALERFREGSLPMVFPTVKMLEALQRFRTVDAALEAFRGMPVAVVLPRLVRTPAGVGIVVDEPVGEE